mmetsp:Transcript_30891/g.74626  ORF Transcript_30891/g.74626 Transcript_30891/m.74626 type:complete len:348 (-) Transcript_30891:873-1916(-)
MSKQRATPSKQPATPSNLNVATPSNMYVDDTIVYLYNRLSQSEEGSAGSTEIEIEIDLRLDTLLDASSDECLNDPNQLRALRDFIKTREPGKSNSARYKKIKNKMTNTVRNSSRRSFENAVNYETTLVKQGKTPKKKAFGVGVSEDSGRPIGSSFDAKKEYYRQIDVQAIPSNTVTVSIYDGEIVNVLSTIPDLEAAKEKFGVDFQPSDRAEGGILEFKAYTNKSPPELRHLGELTNTLRDQIINVVGRGFSMKGDDDPEFSDDDALVAHNLLYPSVDDRRFTGVVAVVIYYYYTDPSNPKKVLMDIAGAILLSQDVAVHKYDAVTGQTSNSTRAVLTLSSSTAWSK